MGAFTSEQEAILAAVRKGMMSYIGSAHQIVHLALNRIGALQNLLLRKGMITEEELEQAIKETEARVAIETAFSPELQALEDEFNRLKRGEGEDQSNQR